MRPWIESVRDLELDQDILRYRPYGMIEARRGQLVRVQLKPWPKIGSVMEARWLSGWKHKRRKLDHCRLYYNQPVGHRRFLALTYFESTLKTSFKTIRTALDVLDGIAYLKKSNAILAEVSNPRISDRAMQRFGWERHLDHGRHRHYIKRFWGEYPERAVKFFESDDRIAATFASNLLDQ